MARLISQLGRSFTGIEIHPGAKIENNVKIGAGAVVLKSTEDNIDIEEVETRIDE